MRHDYDNLKRGAVIPATGKTRVTMYLDDDVIEFFRQRATKNGRGYQTEINAELREAMSPRGEITKLSRESTQIVEIRGEDPFFKQLTDEMESLRSTVQTLNIRLRRVSGTFVQANKGEVIKGGYSSGSRAAKKRPA